MRSINSMKLSMISKLYQVIWTLRSIWGDQITFMIIHFLSTVILRLEKGLVDEK